MMKNRYLYTSVVLVCLCSVLIFSGSSECQVNSSYILGVALGMSGTGEQYSRQALEGIKLAVSEVNANGGLLGTHTIQLAVRDTQTRPDTAVLVVQYLLKSEKVRCVIGTYSSAAALAIKPLLREARVLHIAPISNSEEITLKDPSPYTFSVVPNTYMMAKGAIVGIADLAKGKGWRRYATIASDYEWGRSSQALQVQHMKQIAPWIELVGDYWPKLGQTRFNSFIVDIQARKPDFVLSSIAGTDNGFWMRDARDYRLFKELEQPGGLVSVTELMAQARSLRRGLYGRCRAPFFAHMDNAMMARFVDAYKHQYGRYPSDWAVMGYDAVMVLSQGATKAGTTESEQISKTMKGMAVDTTRGRLQFREIDNQLSCSVYFGRVADDPAYPFPIYHDLIEIKAPQNWRPKQEILEKMIE